MLPIFLITSQFLLLDAAVFSGCLLTLLCVVEELLSVFSREVSSARQSFSRFLGEHQVLRGSR